MVNKQKELMVQEIAEKFRNNSNIILTEYIGLSVEELGELRSKLRSLNCEYKILKNTLTKRVLKDMNLEDFSKYFSGPNAVAIENGDLVSTAKALVEFSKAHDKLKIKAGLLKDKLLSSQDINNIASLPSREVLLSRLVGAIKSPLNGIVNVLQGPIRNFVYVLEAIKKQKQEKGQ